MARGLPQSDPSDTNPLQQWQRIRDWGKHLNTLFMDFLEEDSPVSRKYPHLYEVFWARFNEAMDARNGDPVSKCDETYSDGNTGKRFRADSDLFQRNYTNPNRYINEYNSDYDVADARAEQLCRQLLERLHIRATIGSGTYGTVFLAIEKNRSNSERDRHYVVKVETHSTMRSRSGQDDKPPNMTAIPDEDEDVHFIPLEALILLLTKSCPQFPNIDSVYVDAVAHSIVMGACIDHDILKTRDLYLEGRDPPSFRGEYLNHKKKPVVNELEACKVASQLLEGFIYLWDMNITHSDLSHNNFLIDEELNVQIIDLGMMYFGDSTFESAMEFWSLVGMIEPMMTPEMAIELTKDDWKRLELKKGVEQVDMFLPHSAAIDDFWRLSCTIYHLLHGYAPWEDPDDLKSLPPGYGAMENTNGTHEKMTYERRNRIINEDLPVSENLSQDCVDALRMGLAKIPLDRASPLEMCAMPWFNQHVPYAEYTSLKRPTSIPYEQAKRRCGFRD